MTDALYLSAAEELGRLQSKPFRDDEDYGRICALHNFLIDMPVDSLRAAAAKLDRLLDHEFGIGNGGDQRDTDAIAQIRTVLLCELHERDIAEPPRAKAV